ncbi:hypothetical protein [Cellulomonas persica]|nr:hypothetical protein [Cellulomonas persica]
MPTISTPTLSLTDIGVGIVVQVRYTATFNRFDRQLSALGKTWHSHVTIHDFDGGADPGDVILDFGAPDDRERFAVTVGTTDLAIAKTEQMTVLNRSLLVVDADGVNELKMLPEAFERIADPTSSVSPADSADAVAELAAGGQLDACSVPIGAGARSTGPSPHPGRPSRRPSSRRHDARSTSCSVRTP